MVVDWEPMIMAIIADTRRGAPAAEVAQRAHGTFAAMIVDVAARCRMERVVLSGGCFQNRILTEATIAGLRERGMQPYWHQRIPPNDGAIAVGQIVIAAEEVKKAQERRKTTNLE